MSDQLSYFDGLKSARSTVPRNAMLKLQLSNGYPVDFDQLAQLLRIAYMDKRERIPTADLARRAGLAAQQVKFLISMATAFDVIQPKTSVLTDYGRLLQEYDPFFDDIGTLWYIHFAVATNPRYVVWNRIVTLILPTRRSSTREQIRADLNDLRQWYTDNSIQKHVLKEINTVLGAYTEQRFSRLAYLRRSGEGYALSYREPVPPLVLLASIARYRDVHHPGATAIPLPEIISAPNGPGVIFQLNGDRIRGTLEDMKSLPGLSVESRADLDQLRLAENATANGWMRRYYETRYAH